MIGFIALGGELVRLVWNWLLPPLFGWREITFWQGLGLLALCRMLFGGFGGPRSHRVELRRRVADRIADRLGDHWDRMTPDERERLRQRVRSRCGFDPCGGEGRDPHAAPKPE